jgi:hypothetical protein
MGGGEKRPRFVLFTFIYKLPHFDSQYPTPIYGTAQVKVTFTQPLELLLLLLLPTVRCFGLVSRYPAKSSKILTGMYSVYLLGFGRITLYTFIKHLSWQLRCFYVVRSPGPNTECYDAVMLSRSSVGQALSHRTYMHREKLLAVAIEIFLNHLHSAITNTSGTSDK